MRTSLKVLGILWLAFLSPGLTAKPRQAFRESIAATPEIISQEYCPGDQDLYSIALTLRVTFRNNSGKALILDKKIGQAWYGVTVARNKEDLAAGKYEYHPNIDWFFSGEDQIQEKPTSESPGPDFAILAPGQTFVTVIKTGVVALIDDTSHVVGGIHAGTHLFQMTLAAWNRPTKALGYESSWRRFGTVVTGTINTEPIELQVPRDPKVKDRCK
jgi:hypothetical protein